MDDQTKSEFKPRDGPLFVLRYRCYKVVLRLILYCFGVLIAGVSLFVIIVNHPLGFWVVLAIVLYGFGLLWLIFLVADMLCFREIRLHKDRIVKVGKFIGEIHVPLANAYLVAIKLPPISMKIVVNRDTKRFIARIKEVFYDEYLAERQQARELNNLLADLSGREVEEFERVGTTTMTRLVREEKR